jgi:hypothetical protein
MRSVVVGTLRVSWTLWLVACAQTSRAPAMRGENAGTPDAAIAAEDGGREAAETTAFEVPVRMREGNRYVPGADIAVRVDDAQGETFEVRTDADGVARFELDAKSVPWDVTVAEIGRGAVSILGLTASPGAPVHLPSSALGSSAEEPAPSGIVVSGAIRGRLDQGGLVSLHGEALADFEDLGDSYRALLLELPGTLRMLAIDHGLGPVEQPPVNAVSVELDLDDGDLQSVDLVFPPPNSHELTMTLQIPVSGPLALLDDTNAHKVYVRVGAEQVTVGTSTLVSTDVPGRLAWTTRSVLDAREPQWASVQLANADGTDSAEVTAAPVAGATVELSSYDALEVEADDDGLALRLHAPAYPNVGASLQRADRSLRPWFVYTAGEVASLERAWPELPAGLSRVDLQLSGSLRANAFAYDAQGEPFWNWPHAEARVAVIHARETQPR